MGKLKQAWQLGGLSFAELFRRLWNEMWKDDVLGRAAQAAFFTMLALVPALVLAIGLVSTLSSVETLESLLASLYKALPEPVVALISDQLKEIRERPPIAALSLTALLTLWAASGVFSSLSDCLNSIYDVKERRPFWKSKLIAIGMTLVEAVLVVLGAGLILGGTQIAASLTDQFGLGTTGAVFIDVGRWIAVAALLSLALALVYYTAPDVKQRWQWITPGSVMATILWILLSLGFRLYVANFGDYNATYGALGGVIVLLLWLYLSAVAILLGGEINAIIEHAAPEGKVPGQHEEGGFVDKPDDTPKPAGPTPPDSVPAI